MLISKINKKLQQLIKKLFAKIGNYYNKHYGVFRYFYLIKDKKFPIITICLLNIIAVSLTTALPLITKELVDDFYHTKSYQALYRTMALNIGIIVVSWALGLITSYISTLLQEKLNFNLSRNLQKKNSKVQFDFFKQRNAGEHIYRNTADIGGIVGIIVSIIPKSISIIAQLAFFFIYSFYLSSKLTLIYTSVLPILMVFIILKNIKVRPIQFDLRENSSDINDFHSQFHQGVLTTKVFQNEKFEEIRLVQILKIKIKKVFHLWRTTTFFSSSTLFINSIWSLLILYIGWTMVIENQITLGALIALQMYFARIYTPFQNASNLYSQIVKSSISAERLQDTFTADDEEDAEQTAPINIQGNIAFSNVSFGYKTDQTVLKNISFDILPNTTFGITGPSGAGKTTIISLLAKLYQVNEGQILIDNHKISDISNTFLRKSISLVSQEPYLFPGTILENLKYGDFNANEDEINTALKTANIDEFVNSLDEGIHTRIGKNGIDMSLGQKKRLGLARALVKNSKILVLDEFSASLDEITEKDIMGNIRKNYKFTNIILISHKVSNLLNCDEVLVIEKGEIAQKGKPRELVQKQGLFRKLYQLQYKFFDIEFEENEYDLLER